MRSELSSAPTVLGAAAAESCPSGRSYRALADVQGFARGENRTPDQGLMSPLLYR
jgi:hypothetical protein